MSDTQEQMKTVDAVIVGAALAGLYHAKPSGGLWHTLAMAMPGDLR